MSSTKSFFNPDIFQYLGGGLPELFYHFPPTLTSPTFTSTSLPSTLLQNPVTSPNPASSPQDLALTSSQNLFLSTPQSFPQNFVLTSPQNVTLTSPTPQNVTLTSPSPPMMIPITSTGCKQESSYTSPLPSPPLSTSTFPESACVLQDSRSIPSSIPRNTGDVCRPKSHIFSCLPDASMIHNIPLEQLASSITVPASDNTVSVKVETSPNNIPSSWNHPLPELKSFVSDYLPYVTKSTSCDVLKSLEAVSHSLLPPSQDTFPAHPTERQDICRFPAELQFQNISSSTHPLSSSNHPLPPCSRSFTFTNYNMPGVQQSEVGPIKSDRRNRTKFTWEQLERLESEFQKIQFAVADRKEALAKEIGVPSRTIALWFQNRRAKERRDQTKMRIGDQTD